jgi:plastocyanin
MRRPNPRLRFGARLVLAFFAVVMAGPARAEVIHVTMEQVAYVPAQISAYVGDTVEWDNKDIVAHTATARDNSWDVMVATNSKNSIVLKSAGTVAYYCRLHPNMVGEITVKARE